jgi:predicted PhzF superfamily epimerase YddE/YHI9
MQTFTLKCFGADAGDGNIALVVLGHEGDAAARQALAADWQHSACAFLDRAPSGAWTIDYYYPHMRSPLCLHATLGAAHVLFEQQGHAAPITVHTALRGQALQLHQADGQCAIALQRQPVTAALPDPALCAGLLGVSALASAPAPCLSPTLTTREP